MPKRRPKPAVGPDGWTTVTSGPPARPPGVDPMNTLFPDQSLEVASSKTYEQALKEYNDIRSKLRKSHNYKKVIDFAETVLLQNIIRSPKAEETVDAHLKRTEIITFQQVPSTRGGVHKCICLALGSLCESPESMYQLALLEGLIETFGWRDSESLEKKYTLIAQDPVFNDVDKRLLREIASFEVVETPTAFDLIDESTFVFAPHMEDMLYVKTLQRWPSLTFGNDADVYEISQRPNQVLKIFDEYSKNHMKFLYPEYSMGSSNTRERQAFGNLTFYYRFSSSRPSITSPNTSDISTDGMPILGTREGV